VYDLKHNVLCKTTGIGPTLTRALILLRLWRYINQALTYLLINTLAN